MVTDQLQGLQVLGVNLVVEVAELLNALARSLLTSLLKRGTLVLIAPKLRRNRDVFALYSLGLNSVRALSFVVTGAILLD